MDRHCKLAKASHCVVGSICSVNVIIPIHINKEQKTNNKTCIEAVLYWIIMYMRVTVEDSRGSLINVTRSSRNTIQNLLIFVFRL